jgi:hypothetical protein
MKKLLLTSALAGATLVASNAIAQTTVSGNLDMSFKAISGESTGANAADSHRGFGKEAQINIANKGKLNNGMDYAAGFSIENDGNAEAVKFAENNYINFISGSTTLTLSQDHIQNIDRTLATFVGLPPQDLSSTSNASQVPANGFIGGAGANAAAALGVGIIQTTPVGNFSALYVPSNSSALAGNDNGTRDTDDESAYELGFVGGLGVKGLSAHAFMNKENKANDDTRDNKGQNFGVSYNFGQITAGYNYKKSEFGKRDTAITAARNDTKQHEYGLAFAVSPTLSIGANYAKAENSGTGVKADAESKSIAVGYNLGAIALTAQAAKIENLNFATGAAAQDVDVLYLRASTKF